MPLLVESVTMSYSSYEPNFLFNEDEDDEIEFVCDCCDPKRRKKKPSSEECSEEEEEEEGSEKDLSDDEETEDKIDDGGDSNDLLDEDSEDSRGLTSREESPAPVGPGVAPPPAKSTKPLPPGWFGKGRSKRRRR